MKTRQPHTTKPMPIVLRKSHLRLSCWAHTCVKGTRFLHSYDVKVDENCRIRLWQKWQGFAFVLLNISITTHFVTIPFSQQSISIMMFVAIVSTFRIFFYFLLLRLIAPWWIVNTNQYQFICCSSSDAGTQTFKCVRPHRIFVFCFNSTPKSAVRLFIFPPAFDAWNWNVFVAKCEKWCAVRNTYLLIGPDCVHLCSLFER